MLDFLIEFFSEYGYLAVFVVLLICGFGVPIPEDLTLVAGGVMTGLGYGNVHIMHLVGLAGVLAGDTSMFLLGRYLGPSTLQTRWVRRVLTRKRYARVQKRFAKYGSRLMFIARFLPGLRAPIYLTAGMTRQVSLLHFLLLDGLAALISVPIWVYLGHYGAQNHEWLLLWMKRSKLGLIAALALAAVGVGLYFWYRRDRKRKRLQMLHARRRKRNP